MEKPKKIIRITAGPYYHSPFKMYDEDGKEVVLPVKSFKAQLQPDGQLEVTLEVPRAEVDMTAGQVNVTQCPVTDCEFCKKPVDDQADHGLGECAPICETCNGTGSAKFTEAHQNHRLRKWFKERTGLTTALLNEHMKAIDEKLAERKALASDLTKAIWELEEERKKSKDG